MRYRSGIYLFFVILIAGLISCKSNQICPAFQSTYILDDSLRLMAFSPFGADSMPKYGQAVRKNKNGIIVRESYYRKNYEMRTVKMENQFVPIAADPLVSSDSLYQEEMAMPDSIVLAEGDSAIVDKPATSPPNKPAPRKYIRNYDPKDNYNEEQVFYNKLFGELFVAPKEVPVAADSLQTEGASALPADSLDNSGQNQKKGLFRKKDKTIEAPLLEKADSTSTGF